MHYETLNVPARRLYGSNVATYNAICEALTERPGPDTWLCLLQSELPGSSRKQKQTRLHVAMRAHGWNIETRTDEVRLWARICGRRVE